MRGISTGAYEYRTEAQVAVYLDEQPLTFNSQQVGVRNIDIERVESLPGPQGTLFGSSSQTGTIRYITNKPDSRGLAGQVELRYGTTEGGEDSYEVNGVVNIPIAEDVFAIRAVGYTSHDGGYVDNVFGTSLAGNYDNANLVEDNFNEYDVDGGRLHALWNVNDRWSVLATLLAENTTAEGVWDSDEALGDYKVTRFENEIRTDDWYSASLTLSGDLGFADLSFNYAKFDRDIVYEYDNMTYTQQKDRYWGGGLYSELYYAGDPNYVNYPNYALYNTDYYRGTIFNDQYQERDTFELRLVSKGESRLQWMVGGYYEDIFDHWFYGARIPGLTNTSAWAAAQAYAYFYSTPNYYNDYMPNPNQIYPLPPTDNNYSDELNRSVAQTAFFGELSYDLTEDLTIHGGMRWAEFDRDILEQWAFPQGLIPFGDIGSGGDGSYRDVGKQSDTIYKIGFRYSIDDDRMIYALYSQGFRVGGVNSQRAVQTGRLPQVYDGDFLHNYEVGIKSQWLDNRVTINASAFYMEWEDYMQSATFDQWWLNGTVNAGGAETKGIELQAEWRATDQLTLAANLFVADAEFQDNFCNDFVNNVNLGCVINANGEPVYTSLDSSGNEIQADIVAGMRMPNSPDTKVHASIYYTIPQVFGGNLWLYYDYYYSSDVWNNTANILENNTAGVSPAWSVSSFSAGLELDNQWDIELNIRNLFDDDGYSYVATWEAGYADMFGDPRYHRIRAQERPRTYWLTVRKGFGGT
jgi:outer membrane receptor protein involved in Fe transport